MKSAAVPCGKILISQLIKLLYEESRDFRVASRMEIGVANFFTAYRVTVLLQFYC